MENLFAPWRVEYIEKGKSENCIFCEIFKERDDEKNLILTRSSHSFLIMNKYPYNNGHLMVISNLHKKNVEDFNSEEILDIFSLLSKAIQVLKKTLSPQGFNIGINLGEVAGAGVKDHFHIHIVPRWQGDTNFMPILSETKVISEHLKSTYQKLFPYFKND